MASKIPDKVSLDGLEDKWSQTWKETDVYAFDRTRTRDEIFSVDTPPPTVSGSLHLGHVFSYTHTDTVVRYQRMAGKYPFYPMGWDDNGLPTERRVQNYYGVTCDPSVEYDPNFTAPDEPFDPPHPISRRNFIELCGELVTVDEEKFEELWRHLGLSVDWSMTYTTVGDTAQKISQRAFLKMVERGEAYNSDAPTMWDVDFKTAVAQAEIEDREKGGKFYTVAFPFFDEEKGQASDEYLTIETTRPELIAADVAVAVNPKDERFTHLVGKKILTPLFDIPLEIKLHESADPEKGSGVVMISTWGDITDVTMWRELNLDVHSIIGRDGRIIDVDGGMERFGSINPTSADKNFARLVGKYPNQARKEMEEMLRESGALLAEPREIMHPVKFYEKGDRPLEVVASRQWYIRNGGRDKEIATALKKRGEEMSWHPAFMESRYQNWIDGLNGDWLISRQRYFGVPIPLWYSLGSDGNVDYDNVLVPRDEQLPVDPSSDCPEGYDESQRNQPGGFVADPDILDTWATSSLTPQIAGRWSEDDELFEKVYPMDLRPQAHEIIRTWLFSTALRAHFENDSVPFKNVLISGWILDPDRKKMSKSKGNVVTPMALLEQYGSDAVRYWAANGRPGVDTAFDEGIMKIGRRLVTKILNASKFALGIVDQLGVNEETLRSMEITNRVDCDFLSYLAETSRRAQEAFEKYDYARALEVSETAFWNFCDYYVEIAKGRAYSSQGLEEAKQAAATLLLSIETFTKLFAPFTPFATEEVWSWFHDDSVHTQSWPQSYEIVSRLSTPEDSGAYDILRELSGDVRKYKTEAKVSLKTELKELVIYGDDVLAVSESISADLKDVARAQSVRFESASERSITIVAVDA
jgi:valyl-tRNA synthetase